LIPLFDPCVLREYFRNGNHENKIRLEMPKCRARWTGEPVEDSVGFILEHTPGDGKNDFTLTVKSNFKLHPPFGVETEIVSLFACPQKPGCCLIG